MPDTPTPDSPATSAGFLTRHLPAIVFIAIVGLIVLMIVEDARRPPEYRIYVDLNKELRIDAGAKFYFSSVGELTSAGDWPYQDTVLKKMIGEHLNLVDKAEAQYVIRMMSEEIVTHAIWSSRRKPSTGLAAVGVCTNPRSDQMTDCQNFTIYFFQGETREQMYAKVFERWLRRQTSPSA